MSFYNSVSVDNVGGVEVKLRCNDYPTMWIDGVMYSGKRDMSMGATVSDDIKLMAVRCVDGKGFGGFVASVGYDGNVLVSDGHWKCSDQILNDEKHQWYKPDFDDSHWNHAYVIKLNGDSKAAPHIGGFPDNAAWLWSDYDFSRISGIPWKSRRTIFCRSPVLGR